VECTFALYWGNYIIKKHEKTVAERGKYDYNEKNYEKNRVIK